MHPAHTPVDIAVVGGSGLAEIPLDDSRALPPVATPYGPVPGITVGDLAGRRVAFVARHGAGHRVPPHRLNSRAHLWALAALGAKTLLSTNAVGGLTATLRPGDLVLTDQLIDRTHGRADTYFDGDDSTGGVQHLPFAEPYSRRLRRHAHAVLVGMDERVHPAGVSVVIQGPRFATRAEADWHRAMGADLVNMTQLPEAALAAELGLEHLNIAVVTDTDTDAGMGDDDTSATAERVFAVMAAATPRLIAAVRMIIPALPLDGPPSPALPPEATRAILERQVGAGSP
ncbi:MTAP family purine nucleoside phosphorylase [Microbacterium esteraromaticum]|uniref:Purine nucleoside phosphorylase n=1 Tax=Microbacterium esteraromaticum TaxID=57043 RepID=A0A939DU24_9MICO|nr:MTAP family purine nucleoside phosphorylase [Microbacterium esteraromaticum]MBN8204915.1 MTAP family purine nucleoside phosphorylase [Microbacterium esteraromaticum]MBN8415069.1 MTAP family purine nucleoside phosphorylase [Microbacterium esteraromaticum]